MEKASSRLRLLAVLVVCMFVALTTRLWFLQVMATERFSDIARNNSVRTVETDALRGVIKDVNGTKIVVNRRSVEVRINRQELRRQEDPEAILADLAHLLSTAREEVTVRDLRERLRSKQYYAYQPIPVAEFVSDNPHAQLVADKMGYFIDEHRDRFPPQVVRVKRDVGVRQYNYGSTAAHVLGYLGQINADQYGTKAYRGYGPSDLVGQSGIELSYERFLHGRKGIEKYLVNSDEERIRKLGERPPTAGDTLRLAMDIDVQQMVEEKLVDAIQRARTLIDEDTGLHFKANAGAVVVMDPRDGSIRAMASWPTYDPSWYVDGLTEQQTNYLNESSRAPSLNRAVQQIYAPGSTFKPFTALAAVKEGLATLGGYYPCPAEYSVPGDETTVFHNWSDTDLPSQSLASALKVSCDTVFYDFGYRFWYGWSQNPGGVNSEPFQRDIRQWGFGRRTGVDLPSEAEGVVPDAAYAEDNPDIFPDGWIPGGDILTSIGASYITATPLQLATAYSAIANGGRICHPHLVDRIVSADGEDVVRRIGGHCNRRLPYTPEQLNYIRNALSTVTQPRGTAGTAFSGFPLGTYPVAGKTGTAQRDPFQSTSWFASFVPADDPEYVVVAMVEQGGFGGEVAAPLVRQIIEGIYGLESTAPAAGSSVD